MVFGHVHVRYHSVLANPCDRWLYPTSKGVRQGFGNGLNMWLAHTNAKRAAKTARAGGGGERMYCVVAPLKRVINDSSPIK